MVILRSKAKLVVSCLSIKFLGNSKPEEASGVQKQKSHLQLSLFPPRSNSPWDQLLEKSHSRNITSGDVFGCYEKMKDHRDGRLKINSATARPPKATLSLLFTVHSLHFPIFFTTHNIVSPQNKKVDPPTWRFYKRVHGSLR
ncbi:hypothetical protein PROFUN_15080 [Planoprotostelium fungivorum]|uniref:Uncharacterized protein n=1 Tax=Planoprotostelium fungivorum TaxID=1890364 RepID=A0A2P6MXX1_9EUKA|nr:hypothetical protein PROFUN_15080 [Planoprotostelium fungivorum]